MIEVFEKYLDEVRYKDWSFGIHMDGERAYLQASFWDYDNSLPLSLQACKSVQKGRKWLLSPYMTKSEVIQTAFKAVMTAEEHETREKFTYKGQPVFGPHFNVDVLAEVCKKEVPDLRTDTREKEHVHA